MKIFSVNGKEENFEKKKKGLYQPYIRYQLKWKTSWLSFPIASVVYKVAAHPVYIKCVPYIVLMHILIVYVEATCSTVHTF